MSEYMALGEVRGYTPAEERALDKRIRQLMDYPDMDEIVGSMPKDIIVQWAGLMWDGQSDEARDLLYRYGRRWAERRAEEEVA
jgi:hypothetical protein